MHTIGDNDYNRTAHFYIVNCHDCDNEFIMDDFHTAYYCDKIKSGKNESYFHKYPLQQLQNTINTLFIFIIRKKNVKRVYTMNIFGNLLCMKI